MYGTWIRWRSWKPLPAEPMDVLEIVRGKLTDEHHHDYARGWYWSFITDDYRPQNRVLSLAAAVGRGESTNVDWSLCVAETDRVVR